jgi:hypothetical protein
MAREIFRAKNKMGRGEDVLGEDFDIFAPTLRRGATAAARDWGDSREQKP